MFVNKPTIAFKRNKDIQDLTGGHLVKDGKVAKKKLEKRQGKSKICNTTRSALCCLQVVNTNTFKSFQHIPYHYMQKTMDYLLTKCILCNIQYVGKSETSFNVRLKNHRKDVSNPKAIPTCVHFRKEGHNFIQHVKFTLIDQLTETEMSAK